MQLPSAVGSSQYKILIYWYLPTSNSVVLTSWHSLANICLFVMDAVLQNTYP